MAKGNRPAEVFGFQIKDKSSEARTAVDEYQCPFVSGVCNKKSRLINFPFGVCSVAHNNEIYTTCPRRFEERGSDDIPRVLKDIAVHYFGDVNNVVPFAEVKLPNVGSIDYVLVRHVPMKAEVDDFVAVEFQADSTTGTGSIVQSLRDFVAGKDITQTTYKFGMNTYDTIKRSMTQLLNKGVVYEKWDIKGYWVIQEYIYANLIRRYGFKHEGYRPEHASRFVLYDLVPKENRLTLSTPRFVSTTVEEVYLAMRNNPGLPDKDKFIAILNKKLTARLNVRFS